MHAALMHLTIDPALAPAAAAAFTNELLPRVRTAPGFVAGYWVDPVDRQGFGFVGRLQLMRGPFGRKIGLCRPIRGCRRSSCMIVTPSDLG